MCASTRPRSVAATLSGTFRKVPAGRTRNDPRRPASDPKKRGRFPLGTGAVRRSPPPRSPRSARRASMPRTFPGSRGPRATPSREAPFDAKSTSSTSTATPVTLTAWAFGAAAVTGEEDWRRSIIDGSLPARHPARRWQPGSAPPAPCGRGSRATPSPAPARPPRRSWPRGWSPGCRHRVPRAG